MQKLHIATFQNGAKPQVISDSAMAEFQSFEPYGYSISVARAIEVDGRFYILDQVCPDEGLGEWSNVPSPEEQTREDKILSLKKADRDFLFPGFETRAVKVAKKISDDAEASARAQAAAEAKP